METMDAPYFKHEAMSREAFDAIRQTLIHRDDMWVIDVEGQYSAQCLPITR